MKYILALALTILVGFHGPITADENTLYNIKLEGLSDRENPKLIAQTESGRIYIVSSGGIYSITGNRANKMAIPQHAIEPNQIANYFYDADGRLHFWSRSGMVRVNEHSNQLETVSLTEYETQIVSPVVGNGNRTYLSTSKEYKSLLYPDQLSSVVEKPVDSETWVEEALAISTKGNLIVVNNKGEVLEVLGDELVRRTLNENLVNLDLYEASVIEDTLYVATNKGIYHYSFDNQQWGSIHSELNVGYRHIREFNNQILIPSSELLTVSKVNQNIVSSLSIPGNNNYINDVLVDRDNVTWLLTQSGIWVDSPYIKNAYSYGAIFKQSGVKTGSLHTFQKLGNEMFVGADNGLFSFNLNSNEIKHLIATAPLTSSLNMNSHLVFASTSHVYAYDIQTKAIKTIELDAQYASEGTFARALAHGENNDIWIRNDDAGMSIVDIETGDFSIPDWRLFSISKRVNKTAYMAFSEDKKHIILSLEYLTYIYSFETGEFKRFFYPIPADTREISGFQAGRSVNNFVKFNGKTAMLYDVDSIAVYDEQQNMLFNEPLPFTNARCIAQYNNDIFAVNQSGQLLRGSDGHVFDTQYGIPTDTLNPRECVLDPDTLYLLSTDEMLKISLEHTTTNPRKPQVIINQVSLNGLIADTKSSSMEFEHGEYELNVALFADSYIDTKLQKLRYQLTGFQQQEVIDNNTGAINLRGIKDGQYELLVSVSNSDGVWSETVSVVKFVVHPPLYRSTSAFIVYGLLVVFLAWLLHKVRLKNVQERNAELESLVEDKTFALNEELDFKNEWLLAITHESKTMQQVQNNEFSNAMNTLKENGIEFNDTTMVNSSKKNRRLIDQLLELAKLKNPSQLEFEHVDVAALIKLLVPLYENLAKAHCIDIETDLPDSGLVVLANRSSFERVISNIIGNAIKYNKPGGKVTIKAYLEEEKVHISISDSGAGLSQTKIPDSIDYIGSIKHETEHQVHTKLTSNNLGLHLIDDGIKTNGGYLCIDSALNVGTTFNLTFAQEVGEEVETQLTQSSFKIAEREADSYVENSIDIAQLQSSMKQHEDAETLLIMEDTPELLAQQARHLQAHFNVLVALDGRSGLELAKAHMPDIILTDLNMPELNGYGVIEAVKADKQLSHIPVVLLTAVSNESVQTIGLELGADDVIDKPVGQEELLQRLKNKISARDAIRSTFDIAAFVDKEASNVDSSALTTVDAIEEASRNDFISELNELIDANIADNNKLKVLALARKMGELEHTFTKKVKQITGLTVSVYVRNYRLTIMHKKLQTEDVGKLEVFASEFGYKAAQFSTLYKAHFGVSPSDTAATKPAD